MPLILICGPPASGKTRVANYLADYFTKKQYKVTIVNEESLEIDKIESYKGMLSFLYCVSTITSR